MLMIVDLPECIFFLLKNYLSHSDYRNIFNSCKKDYFQELKKKSCFYSLTEECTRRYFFNVEFQQKVLNLIENPSKQLGVFVDYCELPSDNLIRNINSVRFRPRRENNLTNLSLFETTEQLYLSHVKNVKSCQGLSSLIVLSLFNCEQISDVSALANCHSLTEVRLTRCKQIKDINSLAHVKILTIERCGVKDNGITKLGSNMEQLILIHSRITTLNHLISLKKLYLEYCYDIESISSLSSLTIFTIFHCRSFRTYSNLISLRKLDIGLSENFQFNYSNSFTIQELILNSEIPIDFNKFPISFQNLQFLDLRFDGKDTEEGIEEEKINLDELANIPSLKSLTLNHLCKKQKFNVHLFQQLKSLIISQSNCFEGISLPMPSLKIIRFSSCPGLRTINGLAGNTNMIVDLPDCKNFPFHEESFYQLLMNGIDKFVYNPCSDFRLTSLSTTMPNEQVQLDQEDIVAISRKIRDKVFMIHESFAWKGVMLSSLLMNLRMLILCQLQDVMDLSSLVSAGIHKIPVFYLKNMYSLRSLYPAGVVPEHEWLILDRCHQLEDISGIGMVPRVSIKHCDNLLDIRPLHGCDMIDFEQNNPDAIGYDELNHRMNRFPSSFPVLEELLTPARFAVWK